MLPAPPSFQLRPVDRAEAIVSHRFGAESDSSDVEMRTARHPHPGHQSNSSSGGGAILAQSMAPAAAPALTALRAIREDDPRKNEWTKYTHPPPDTSSGTDFECTWEIKERDGTTRRCGYSSKKHLVKRHIESKHLQLRCAAHAVSSRNKGADPANPDHACALSVAKDSPKRAIWTRTLTPSASILTLSVFHIHLTRPRCVIAPARCRTNASIATNASRIQRGGTDT